MHRLRPPASPWSECSMTTDRDESQAFASQKCFPCIQYFCSIHSSSQNSLTSVCLLTNLCLIRLPLWRNSLQERILPVFGNIYSHSSAITDTCHTYTTYLLLGSCDCKKMAFGATLHPHCRATHTHAQVQACLQLYLGAVWFAGRPGGGGGGSTNVHAARMGVCMVE